MNENMIDTNNTNSKRRGRPKGSLGANFINISKEDLLNKINSENLGSIKVSRTWFNKIQKANNLNSDNNTENSVQNEPIEFTIS